MNAMMCKSRIMVSSVLRGERRRLFFLRRETIMIQRLGFVGLIIEDPVRAADINKILSRHSRIIAGRMGIPRLSHNESGISVITLIVQGSTDEIGALTGQLGTVSGVQVRSALSSK
jgi:putative iron-only hydrogenase system regulator